MKKLLFTKGLTVAGKTTTAKYLDQSLQKVGIDSSRIHSAMIKSALYRDYYKTTYVHPYPDPDYYRADHPVGGPQRFQAIYVMCFGYSLKDIDGAEQKLLDQNKEVVILDSTFLQRRQRKLVYDLAKLTDSSVYSLEIVCNDVKEISRRFDERARKWVKDTSEKPELEAAEKIIYDIIQANEREDMEKVGGIETDPFPNLVRIGYNTTPGISNPVELIRGKTDEFVGFVIKFLRELYEKHQSST